jgi:hypothetical protein
VDDLLHLLDAAEVTQHVADRDDVAILDELAGDGLAAFNGASADGLFCQLFLSASLAIRQELGEPTDLFDKVGSLGEVLDQLQFQVGSLGSTATVCGRAADDNSTVKSA